MHEEFIINFDIIHLIFCYFGKIFYDYYSKNKKIKNKKWLLHRLLRNTKMAVPAQISFIRLLGTSGNVLCWHADKYLCLCTQNYSFHGHFYPLSKVLASGRCTVFHCEPSWKDIIRRRHNSTLQWKTTGEAGGACRRPQF